jgi:uncharacterized radical SAM protein YgiQ
MFLPTTPEEMRARGWHHLDVILVTGDSYIDSPFIGAALIGKVLFQEGFRVGVIAQPDTAGPQDITRLGRPNLFWGVTGGSVDSMVANYTPLNKRRRSDDFTPGGRNDRRPDRAVLVYTNLIRRFAPSSAPIVLGGIEASLRRLAHYDFWSDRLRRSVLLDAKADYLLYGMAEETVVALARCLAAGGDPRGLAGLCYAAPQPPPEALPLPSWEDLQANPLALLAMFRLTQAHRDPGSRPLAQRHAGRWVVQTPPAPPLSTRALDAVYGLEFERELHPYYRPLGEVRALETIRFAITTHRGCYGECSFCAIALHQGRTVTSRSPEAILEEARRLTAHPLFKGTIADVGGPTANMYGFECARKRRQGPCQDRRCLYPEVCRHLRPDHTPQIHLLEMLRRVPGVRRVFVASGLRYDLLLADRRAGQRYLDQLVRHHVSGQLKVAPEHTQAAVLACMGKPGPEQLELFRERFQIATRAAGKPQFLTYYLMAAHPGCTLEDMQHLRHFVQSRLKLIPEQVQIFTPTPSTAATLMYATGRDPESGNPLFVEKIPQRKAAQKAVLARPAPGPPARGR